MSQIKDLLAINKAAHMRTHFVLLVNDTESEAGVLTIQVVEQFRQCRTTGFGLAFFGV